VNTFLADKEENNVALFHHSEVALVVFWISFVQVEEVSIFGRLGHEGKGTKVTSNEI
jgi:hypothetical protein